MSEESLQALLSKEKEGKAEIYSWYDEGGNLCLDFTFDSEEAEHLANLVVDCISLLVPEIRKRHEQQYENMSFAGSLVEAAQGGEG